MNELGCRDAKKKIKFVGSSLCVAQKTAMLLGKDQASCGLCISFVSDVL